MRQPRSLARLGAVIGALIFYALVVEKVGFHLTTLIILSVLFSAFSVRPRWILPLAVVLTCGFHLAFYSLLRVALPWGWLENFAW